MSNDDKSTTKRKRSGGSRVKDRDGNLLLRIPGTKPLKPVDRPGRPLKRPKPGTTVSLGLRVPAELKDMLDAAADDADRSQSEEAARRLAASFELQPIKEIMTIFNPWQPEEGGRWQEDPAKATLVIQLVETYLKSLLTAECRKAMEAGANTDKALESVLKKLAYLKVVADGGRGRYP